MRLNLNYLFWHILNTYFSDDDLRIVMGLRGFELLTNGYLKFFSYKTNKFWSSLSFATS